MSLLIFLLFAFLSPSQTLAVDEFSLSQDIVYTINQSGLAVVQNKVELKNNFSEIYPQQYVFSLGQTGLVNIIANDSAGDIIDHVDTDQSTKIYLKFNQPGIGKDKITKFTIHYQIPSFAEKKGKLYQVSLPTYNSSSQNTNIELKIPKNFGQLAFSSISANILQHHDNLYNIIKLNKVEDQKILLIFGEYQFFDFDLQYFIQNTNSYPINTEIPLPPDTNSQSISFSQIEPRPLYINQDLAGNWLAQYQLQPQQSLNISVKGQAKIFPPIPQTDQINLEGSLSEQNYWPVSDPTIKQIAQKLTTPKQIYDYVVSTLNYDYNQINSAQRKGALLALEQPNNSLCTEFTDLFVTLARAANIPSREIEGFAYTTDPSFKPINQNADVLHAWPQYYDPDLQSWVSIDPTWADTTQGIDFFHDLDLNHLAFVIHQQDSLYPYPPGSYKKATDAKTVSVTFSQKEPGNPTPQPLQISSQTSNLFNPPSITITNPNLNSLKNITITNSNSGWKQLIQTLPPLGQTKISLPQNNFFSSLLPKHRFINLTVSQANNNQNHQIKNPSYLINLLIFLSIIIFVISTSCIIVIVSKRRR